MGVPQQGWDWTHRPLCSAINKRNGNVNEFHQL
jgi:hypothetical protein